MTDQMNNSTKNSSEQRDPKFYTSLERSQKENNPQQHSSIKMQILVRIKSVDLAQKKKNETYFKMLFKCEDKQHHHQQQQQRVSKLEGSGM